MRIYTKPGTAPVSFECFRNDPSFDGVRDVLISTRDQRVKVTSYESALMQKKLIENGFAET